MGSCVLSKTEYVNHRKFYVSCEQDTLPLRFGNITCVTYNKTLEIFIWLEKAYGGAQKLSSRTE